MTAIALGNTAAQAAGGAQIRFANNRTAGGENVFVKGSTFANSVITFENDGDFTHGWTGVTGGVTPSIGPGEWLAWGTPSDWEIRLTKTAGSDFSTGPALNTWLSLGTTRQWSMEITLSGTGSISGTYTVDFRKSGDTDPRFTFTGLVVQAVIT